MPVVIASGSTATDGSEQTLTTQTSNGTFVFVVDTSPMVNDDIMIFNIKTKVLSGSTSRIAYTVALSHIQSDPNKYSIPVPSNNEIVVTMQRLFGTDHTFDWALLAI